MTACTYCGCAVEDHDPVYVSEGDGTGGRDGAGAFCNYACLVAHVQEQDLTAGATCRLELS